MRRRVAILTDSTFASLRFGADYARESSTYDEHGDLSTKIGESIGRAVERLDAAADRDVALDVRALRDVLGTAIDNSCSCVGVDVNGVYHGGKIHRASGHAVDCWVALSHRSIGRVRSLIELLSDGGKRVQQK